MATSAFRFRFPLPLSGIAIAIATLLVVAVSVRADSIVTVDGETYRCDNTCVVDLGPPLTVRDCCGGAVWILISQPAPEDW